MPSIYDDVIPTTKKKMMLMQYLVFVYPYNTIDMNQLLAGHLACFRIGLMMKLMSYPPLWNSPDRVQISIRRAGTSCC